MYFPRFFHFFHEAMETWFDERLGLRYAELVGVRKLGFPAVHTEADFKLPCAMGQEIAVALRVARLGRTSIRLEYEVRLADEPEGPLRLSGATVSAVMDLDPQRPTFRRAVELPADLRARIEAFGVSEARKGEAPGV